MIICAEGDTPAEEREAQTVLEILNGVYSWVPWHVSMRGGVIHIKDLSIANRGWGMAVKFKNINHDSAVLRREIIMKAGEWLERAGKLRHRDDHEDIRRVDGLPAAHQPIVRQH